jgi:hypothetical protein
MGRTLEFLIGVIPGVGKIKANAFCFLLTATAKFIMARRFPRNISTLK